MGKTEWLKVIYNLDFNFVIDHLVNFEMLVLQLQMANDSSRTIGNKLITATKTFT